MTLDPRLRLLGTDATPDAEGVLQLLDATEITIRLGHDVTAACDSAVIGLAALAARLFGHVHIDPPRPLAASWWGISHTDQLPDALSAVRVHTTTPIVTRVTVTVGSAVPGETDTTFGIGGDDYTVRLAREPQAIDGHVTHCLGLHAAACLAIGQLLTHVLLPTDGFAGVPVNAPYVMNLIDYKLTPAPDLPEPGDATDQVPLAPLNIAFAGIGSVGTSALALLAQARAPQLAPQPAGQRQVGRLVTIDKDAFDPTRNPYRNPALLGGEDHDKAPWAAGRLTELGLPAESHPGDVASWVQAQSKPGFDGLLVSSVDTLAGRLDVADVLARQTLSLGVDGLRLHAQREHFADGFACPYCDYVTADPPMTQADVHSQLTGLPIPRILALAQPDAKLTAADVDAAIAAGRLAADRRDALVGASFNDLIRQAYAEIEIGGGPAAQDVDTFTLAAPHVSWFAGVLAAVEIVKELHGLPLVDRRVDVDLLGLPPGLTRRPAADITGRCVCHGRRVDWYRRLYC